TSPGAFYDIGFVTDKCSVAYGACETSAFPPGAAVETLFELFDLPAYRTNPEAFLACAGDPFCVFFLPSVQTGFALSYIVFEWRGGGGSWPGNHGGWLPRPASASRSCRDLDHDSTRQHS